MPYSPRLEIGASGVVAGLGCSETKSARWGNKKRWKRNALQSPIGNRGQRGEQLPI